MIRILTLVAMVALVALLATTPLRIAVEAITLP